MQLAIIRVDRPFLHPPHYVRSVSRDGDFALTRLKTRARRFTLKHAASTIPTLRSTLMQFSVCDAPEASC